MSFKLKTIIGIALIEIFVLAILVGTSLHDLRASNERELKSRAHTSAQLLATMTTDAVVAYDLATLDVLIDQVLSNEGLQYVRITNEAGTVLSEGGAAPAENSPPEIGFGETKMYDNTIEVRAPISVGRTGFGTVQIGLSTAQLNDVVAAGTNRMLTIAGIEVVIVAIFGFFLGTILTRQLNHLRDGAARVAKGEFGYHMPVKGNDELASTARSFNQMSSALADYARVARSEKEEADAGRRFAESLLHNAINSVSQAIFIVGGNKELRFVNRAALELYGLSGHKRHEGMPFRDVLLAAYSSAPVEDLDGQLESMEERLKRLDAGQVQTWQSHWSDNRMILHTQRPMISGGFVLVDSDVTEMLEVNEMNRRLEMELMETHKLESLGTLASGVAHEINTPTQFIGDNLKFLREAFDDLTDYLEEQGNTMTDAQSKKLEEIDWQFLKDEIPSALSEAAEGVGSIGKIVQSIKEFAHPDDSETTETDMVKLVENAITVSRSQWRHSAELNFKAVSGEVMVPCYPGDISQVIINLIVNAADAISENAQSQDYVGGMGEISVNLSQDDTHCTISVTDNGPGIPGNSLRRIFDMFYTTKPPGKGTGQGLAICKSIVEMKHKGKLFVQSKLGAGSTFVVTLPLLPAASRDNEPETHQAA
ncbi:MULTISPECIES: ATP-binding protein [unclassified Roseibium]|uniref:sensor histidine kinase n=1 Tax=unclassified Roseibium TaxID=2629323 RepID=UPI00273FFEDB|nr:MULTISPECIES: ATP-binding protein [unclassified Roseibium]